MNPVNQMNSMYQSPLQQNNSHKSSILAIIIFLIIAIIVAVLGFGRIGTLKNEDAAARQSNKQNTKTQQDVNVFSELDATLAADSKSDTDKIDQEFK